MRIYPLIFNQCWFSKFKVVFSPPIFFWQCVKEKLINITVLKCIPVLLCRFKHKFGSDFLMLVVSYCKHLFFVIPLIIMQRKPLIICWQTGRQMDIINPAFYFCQSVRTAWTLNAYQDMLMRIFTPCLFFQCVFTNFQCVITLLRALSVALWPWARKVKVKVTGNGHNSVEVIKVYKPTKHQIWTGSGYHRT